MWRGGELIELTPTEYRLLRYLLPNARRVLTETQILDHVWDYDFGGDASVARDLHQLPAQEDRHGEPPLIHTVRGVGYSLRLPPEHEMTLRNRLVIIVAALVGHRPRGSASVVTYQALQSFLLDRLR